MQASVAYLGRLLKKMLVLFFTEQQEVELVMRNNELVIRIVPKNLADAILALPAFPDDISADDIKDLPPQEREF